MARLFDGVDDFIDLATETNFDFDRLDPFSYMFGVKTIEPNIALLISKIVVTTIRGWELAIVSGKARFQLISDVAGDNQVRVDSTNAINDGNKKIIVLTYSGSGTAAGVKIFIDATKETNVVISDGLTATTLNNVNLELGNRSDGTFDYDGNISDFAVWDVELSEAEAKALGRGVSPFAIRNQSLKSYLPLYGNQSPEPDFKKQTSKGTVTGTTKDVNPPIELIENYL